MAGWSLGLFIIALDLEKSSFTLSLWEAVDDKTNADLVVLSDRGVKEWYPFMNWVDDHLLSFAKLERKKKFAGITCLFKNF